MSTKIKIILKSPTGQSIEHEIEKSSSLKQLKSEISEKIGQNSMRVLRLNGSQLLDDRADLTACKISEDTVLQLHDGIKIYIRLSSAETISLLVDPDDTIAMVKNLIHLKRGVPSEAQLLRFFTHRLDNDWLISAYGIKSGDTLFLSQLPINAPLNLNVRSGKDSIRLTVEHKEKVKKVAETIAAMFEHKLDPWEKMDVVFKKQTLDPDSTLEACHIIDQSTIFVFRRYLIGQSASTQV